MMHKIELIILFMYAHIKRFPVMGGRILNNKIKKKNRKKRLSADRLTN